MTSKEGHAAVLYECPGTVHSIWDFAVTHMDILSEFEQALIKKSFNLLPKDEDIPALLRMPRTRSKCLAFQDSQIVVAARCGARSAYWVDQGIILKACRPVENADFPAETLFFGTDNIVFSRIPFGVLSAEGAMREILAFCFVNANRLPVHRNPLCIYEYVKDSVRLGYSLVMETLTEQRVESFIDYPEHTIADLITADVIRSMTGFRGILGYEVNIKGINKWWYVEQKAALLSEMNFYGAFRGLLNSNIGNDVIKFGDGKATKLFICDFDTFELVNIPSKPSREFLRAFILRCTVEALKGSLPIIDLVDHQNNDDPITVANKVKKIFFNISGIWKSYKRNFDIKARKMGWNEKLIDQVFLEIQETPAFIATVLDSVPNIYTLKKAKKIEDSMYTPHN
ncbi:MAG: hypothetical protein HQK96_11735 [Nitrospirae bacterium]|nr:hypothetical protein [Nitrospirota bacterium]